jgi:hypothetical protein
MTEMNDGKNRSVLNVHLSNSSVSIDANVFLNFHGLLYCYLCNLIIQSLNGHH